MTNSQLQSDTHSCSTMNSLSFAAIALICSLSLALPIEQIREKRQMGMYSPYGSMGAFPSYGNPYGSMMYQRSVPMMPVAYAPSSLYSPMSMGSLGYGTTNPSFMAMGFRARNRARN